MRKQKSNIVNAQNAIARSDVEWTKETGIDDPDLINSLRISVKERLERYEKGLAELEAQLSNIEKRRGELKSRPHAPAREFFQGEEQREANLT